MADILPDSRCKVVRDSQPSSIGNLIPVFCANCGKPWGRVPEKMCTFAFVLCEPCVDAHGIPAHFRTEPDSEFWARVSEEQKIAELKTFEDFAKAVSDPSTPLGKLAKDFEKKLGKIA